MSRGKPNPKLPLIPYQRSVDTTDAATDEALLLTRGQVPPRPTLPMESSLPPPPPGPEKWLEARVIYKLPTSEAYVFALLIPFGPGQGWYLRGDDLRQEASFAVDTDGEAVMIPDTGPPIEPFHVMHLRKVPGCEPIKSHTCKEWAFPDHAEVCPLTK